VRNPKTRTTKHQWTKKQDRNEALDLWVYALAGFWILTRILAPELSGPEGQKQLERLAARASGKVPQAQDSGRGGLRMVSRGVA
jgi:phage terminase large subunit GpA-like protein